MPSPRDVAIVLMLTAASGAHAQNIPGAGTMQNLPGPSAMTTNVMLCDSPEHAVAFTVAVNKGDPDDMAKDVVGRAAGAEVCDKFIGRASIEEQKTLWDKGLAYTVMAYKFKGVGAMRWSAIPKDQQ